MAPLSDEHFYQHSGRHGYAAPAVMLIAIPAAILLSAVYSYIVVYIPIVGYVNILFLGGLIVGVGAVFGLVATKSKCRSPALLGFLGLLTGLVTLYASWVFFISALGRHQGAPIPAMRIATNPGAMWEFIKLINAEGWWGPSGAFQWTIVSVEAFIMVAGIGFIGLGCIERDVFCEDCGTWCQPEATKHMRLLPGAPAPEPSQPESDEEAPNEGAPNDEGLFAGATEAAPDADGFELPDDLTELNHLDILKLPQAEPTEFPRFTAEVLRCTGCGETTAIRFKIEQRIVEDGEVKESSEDLPGILIRKSTEEDA